MCHLDGYRHNMTHKAALQWMWTHATWAAYSLLHTDVTSHIYFT